MLENKIHSYETLVGSYVFRVTGLRNYASGSGNMTQDEGRLAESLATDLDNAFTRLVSVYQHRLYAFLLRQTGSPQDAEDIVQEAFIQAYFALGAYPVQRVRTLKIHPWLYKIALNIFYNRRRTSRLQYTSLDEPKGEQHLELEDEVNRQPEAIFEGHESVRELEMLVVRLPEQYREAVNLYYFVGLSYQEIADVLNLPMGTVKTLIP